MIFKNVVFSFCCIGVMLGQDNMSHYRNEIDLLKEHGVSTTRIDNNNLLIRHNDGSLMIKNIQQTDYAPTDTGDLIVTLADMDTAEYYSKYKFFAELSIGESYAPNKFIFVDANKNGRK